MKEPRKGKILEPPTLKEVIHYTANELRSALFRPGRQKRFYYKRHSRTGSVYAMLTIIAIFIYISQAIQKRFISFRFQIPASAYVGAAGFLIAGLLLNQFMIWPAPQHQLDVASLVQAFTLTPAQKAEQLVSTPSLITIVPTELFRENEAAFMLEEPFVVSSETFGPAFWKDAEDLQDGADVALAPTPLPDVPGIHHTVKTGENLWDIAIAYRAEFNVVDYENVLAYNPQINPRRMMPGDKVFIPGAEKIIAIQQRSRYGMRLPLKNAMITSGYGLRKHPLGGATRFHHGVDFRGDYGQPIYSVLAGTVAYAGYKGQLGNIVEIEHSNGISTIYAHTSKMHVKRGQRVARGQMIARVGSTGRATGAHLHFEVKKNEKSVNPTLYLPQLKAAPKKYAKR